MHRIVALSCVALPLGILDSAQMMTPVMVFFVSYALFGLDAIGEEIEQPFGDDTNDLPLSRLCRTIETDVRTISAQTAMGHAAGKPQLADVEDSRERADCLLTLKAEAAADEGAAVDGGEHQRGLQPRFTSRA